MNQDNQNSNIFLIGPGSVGKSTIGVLLAKKLNWEFVDVDQYFRREIDLIPKYVKQYSYQAYCRRNSTLLDNLIERFPSRAVFATPGGLLACEGDPNTADKNAKLIDSGVSVLLLPSQVASDSVDLIASRQIDRFSLEMSKEEEEREMYIARHALYSKFGKIKIIGLYSPDETVDLILSRLF